MPLSTFFHFLDMLIHLSLQIIPNMMIVTTFSTALIFHFQGKRCDCMVINNGQVNQMKQFKMKQFNLCQK